MEHIKEDGTLSKFQYSNVRLSKVFTDFEDNAIDLIEANDFEPNNIQVITEQCALDETGKSRAISVTIKLLFSDKPLVLIGATGNFYSEGFDDVELEESLFSIKAPTLLISEIRPILNLLMRQANIDYRLPLLDLTKASEMEE